MNETWYLEEPHRQNTVLLQRATPDLVNYESSPSRKVIVALTKDSVVCRSFKQPAQAPPQPVYESFCKPTIIQ